MKKLLIICSISILLSSCIGVSGSGNITTENRPVSNFDGISASSSIDVEVTIGSTYNVTVEADDNVQHYVETNVQNGLLKIGFSHVTNLHNYHVKVLVTAPLLKKISASSSASIMVNDVIKVEDKIIFNASSSADIEASVEAPYIEADANSSATITLKGKTKNFKAEASSSANLECAELLSETTNASAHSSGTAHVHASVSLDAHASSSGDVKYRGGASVKQTVSSSGSVEKE
ncbi:MAG: DUF2807 domain-containing protein [Chitinophagaceae bacterium]|nr:DUF2807 domain-containing protein [Chitinophagaceae bacterium]